MVCSGYWWFVNDEPYTIVVDGEGHVEERKIGDHFEEGRVINTSLSVLSNPAFEGRRTVVLTRFDLHHLYLSTNIHFQLSLFKPYAILLKSKTFGPEVVGFVSRFFFTISEFFRVFVNHFYHQKLFFHYSFYFIGGFIIESMPDSNTGRFRASQLTTSHFRNLILRL